MWSNVDIRASKKKSKFNWIFKLQRIFFSKYGPSRVICYLVCLVCSALTQLPARTITIQRRLFSGANCRNLDITVLKRPFIVLYKQFLDTLNAINALPGYVGTTPPILSEICRLLLLKFFLFFLFFRSPCPLEPF